MNKLTALSKLAGAYHHLDLSDIAIDEVIDEEAFTILASKFGYIRRSLRIEDLKPAPKDTEGLNPKGPVHF
jgi:hypothetical protein